MLRLFKLLTKVFFNYSRKESLRSTQAFFVFTYSTAKYKVPLYCVIVSHFPMICSELRTYTLFM